MNSGMKLGVNSKVVMTDGAEGDQPVEADAPETMAVGLRRISGYAGAALPNVKTLKDVFKEIRVNATGELERSVGVNDIVVHRSLRVVALNDGAGKVARADGDDRVKGRFYVEMTEAFLEVLKDRLEGHLPSRQDYSFAMYENPGEPSVRLLLMAFWGSRSREKFHIANIPKEEFFALKQQWIAEAGVECSAGEEVPTTTECILGRDIAKAMGFGTVGMSREDRLTRDLPT